MFKKMILLTFTVFSLLSCVCFLNQASLFNSEAEKVTKKQVNEAFRNSPKHFSKGKTSTFITYTKSLLEGLDDEKGARMV